MGRNPIYETKEEMEEIIDAYFEEVTYTTDEGRVITRPTMAGLAYALGICRQSLINYSNKDMFMDTIKRARNKVEAALEDNLYGTAVTGTIFNLKNNFGWKDVKENVNTNTNRASSELSDAELEAIASAGSEGIVSKAEGASKVH